MTSEISTSVKGLTLYLIGNISFVTFCLLQKIGLQTFNVAVSELNYVIALFTLPLFYLIARQQKQDVFNVPKATQSTLFWRVLTGVLADLFLCVAYEYTSYSKAFCLY